MIVSVWITCNLVPGRRSDGWVFGIETLWCVLLGYDVAMRRVGG